MESLGLGGGTPGHVGTKENRRSLSGGRCGIMGCGNNMKQRIESSAMWTFRIGEWRARLFWQVRIHIWVDGRTFRPERRFRRYHGIPGRLGLIWFDAWRLSWCR